MFELFNYVLYSSLLMASPVLVARNYLDDVPKPPMGGVERIVFRDPKFWSDPECLYSGVVSPYVRDWEETVDNGFSKTTQPPEPDKIAGYALIINKKECNGKPVEYVAYARPWTGRGGAIDKGGKLQFDAMTKANQPNWLRQVMASIEQAAKTNKSAKDFMDFTQQAVDAAKAANAGKPAQAQ